MLLLLLAYCTPLLAAELLISESPDRSAPQSLDTDPVSGLVYIFVGSAEYAEQVRFYLDGSHVQTENTIPWDFSGTTPDDLGNPLDTRDLADGNYEVRADVYQGGTVVENLTSMMRIANQAPPEAGGDARQLHIGWEVDPGESLVLMWFSPLAAPPASVEYRRSGESVWSRIQGVLSHSTADGDYLKAALDGLLPDTAYEFRVALADGVWSKVYQAYTAPAAGPADFDAVFLADTGLVGRLDGLATGTAQVIEEIALLNPRMILLGGDYAYFDTDKRYVTLERTIAAWFEQMADIAGQSPMMPTYGNHEVLLGEGFETWVDFFPTPDGWNGRRMYSFDAGEAHFVSVFGVNEYQRLSDDALSWLQTDLAAATGRGQRWLVPYFHAAPFSEGTNHSSALALRDQLGPLFEAAGVQLVLTAHDQSYERTYPMVDVPSLNNATSERLHCYGMDDGVSWVKIGPGGKLSNISGDFSPWRTPVPPDWTAFRNNTLHHYGHLSVTATGILNLDVIGVVGDGSAPLVVDRVRYSVAGCEPEVVTAPRQVTLLAEPGEFVSESLAISGESGASLNFEVTQVPGWLSVSQLSGTTPASIELQADTSALPVGEYSAILQVSVGQDTATWVPVILRVGGSSYELMVSDNPERAGAVSLNGATLQGDQYIFTSPDEEVSQVRFYMDDASGTGTVTKTEGRAPFDLAGTAPDDLAYPYATASLADGAHELGARITLSGGLDVLVSAGFMVANDVPRLDASPGSILFSVSSPELYGQQNVLVQMTDGSNPGFTATSTAAWLDVSPPSGSVPETLVLSADASELPPGDYQGSVVVRTADGGEIEIPVRLVYDQAVSYSLEVSMMADRSNPIPLSGATLSGDVYVFVADSEGMKRVTFYLDDPDRAGSAIKLENRAPWDFAGTDTKPPRDAYAYNLNGLSGQHTITALVQDADGEHVIHSSFDVSP
ncbi:BACON domain-containing protein [Marinobacter salinexigens]|nr:fibronectin type III domain-containing protein [Marinobacter salinexigens]